MERNLSFSICMATYNGEKYIQQQIESILNQMNETDEIIISDDGSFDRTLNIIDYYMKIDDRIKLIKGPKMGFSCNFGNAMLYAKKEIIIFSDQDDIWKINKIDSIYEKFSKYPNCTTVLHNMETFTDDIGIDTHRLYINYHSGFLKNFIKSSYWGCCMAVKRSFVNSFLPLREYCVGHDQLIGLMSEKFGETVYIEEKLIKHRLHDSNTSSRNTIMEGILFRKNLWLDFIFAEDIYKKSYK